MYNPFLPNLTSFERGHHDLEVCCSWIHTRCFNHKMLYTIQTLVKFCSIHYWWKSTFIISKRKNNANFKVKVFCTWIHLLGYLQISSELYILFSYNCSQIMLQISKIHYNKKISSSTEVLVVNKASDWVKWSCSSVRSKTSASTNYSSGSKLFSLLPILRLQFSFVASVFQTRNASIQFKYL